MSSKQTTKNKEQVIKLRHYSLPLLFVTCYLLSTFRWAPTNRRTAGLLLN